jgi:hypothetical protein
MVRQVCGERTLADQRPEAAHNEGNDAGRLWPVPAQETKQRNLDFSGKFRRAREVEHPYGCERLFAVGVGKERDCARGREI